MKLSILGARVIDPTSGLDNVIDLHLEAGKIIALGEAPAGFVASQTIEAIRRAQRERDGVENEINMKTGKE